MDNRISFIPLVFLLLPSCFEADCPDGFLRDNSGNCVQAGGGGEDLDCEDYGAVSDAWAACFDVEICPYIGDYDGDWCETAEFHGERWQAFSNCIASSGLCACDDWAQSCTDVENNVDECDDWHECLQRYDCDVEAYYDDLFEGDLCSDLDTSCSFYTSDASACE